MKIKFLIITFFYLNFVLFSGLVVHEYTHKFELRDVNKINDNFCWLNCKINDTRVSAYYEFVADIKNEDELNNLNKILSTTELHAYSIQFLYTSILLSIFLIILIQFKGGEK